MRHLFLILFLLVTGAANASELALRKQVMALITAYDKPATADQWLRLKQQPAASTPAVENMMMRIYSETPTVRIWRARLLNGLRHFPTQPVRQFLTQVADNNDLLGIPNDSMLRREAVSSLIFINGTQELPHLRNLLRGNDWRLRQHILGTLIERGDEASLDLVREHLAQEKNTVIKRRSNQLLQRRFKAQK